MSDMCDNMYSICNLMVIQVAWFLEKVVIDLNQIRKDIVLMYEEDNNPIEYQGRERLKNSGLLIPYKYANEFDERIDEYDNTEEDWLEPWDKV